jgi:hypothetical protein
MIENKSKRILCAVRQMLFQLSSTNKLPNNSKTQSVHITTHTFILASTTIMANGKKVAKAPKSKSQPKAPAKKQLKQKAPPAPCKATYKRPAEELSSDDESEDKTPQKPQTKCLKVIEHVDSNDGGRVPGLATYTGLKVDRVTGLSYLCCVEVGM